MRSKSIEEVSSSDRWLISYAGFVTLVMAFFVIMYANSQKKQKAEAKPAPQVTAAAPDLAAAAFQLSFESEVREMLPADAVASDTFEFEPSSVLSKGVIVRVLAPRFFQPGQSEVSPEFKPLLDRIGSVILKSGKSVQITGHADAEDSQWIVAHPDSRHRNTWELSAARAAWIAQYWMKRLKWDPTRLGISAYSRYRPLSEGTVVAKAPGAQRRIEILVVD